MYTPEELQALKEKNQHDEALQFLKRFDRKQLAEMLADCRWEYREKEMQEASRRGEIRKLEQRLEAANEKIDELEGRISAEKRYSKGVEANEALVCATSIKQHEKLAKIQEGVQWCGASEVLLTRQLNHEDVAVRMASKTALEFVQHVKDLVGVGESND